MKCCIMDCLCIYVGSFMLLRIDCCIISIWSIDGNCSVGLRRYYHTVNKMADRFLAWLDYNEHNTVTTYTASLGLLACIVMYTHMYTVKSAIVDAPNKDTLQRRRFKFKNIFSPESQYISNLPKSITSFIVKNIRSSDLAPKVSFNYSKIPLYRTWFI